ncbi:MAG: hypothetical protein S4CHLAM102_11390 [Chlamydiia bacterium]|nr:hypothetical protein [Chlamydiia bacterium]
MGCSCVNSAKNIQQLQVQWNTSSTVLTATWKTVNKIIKKSPDASQFTVAFETMDEHLGNLDRIEKEVRDWLDAKEREVICGVPKKQVYAWISSGLAGASWGVGIIQQVYELVRGTNCVTSGDANAQTTDCSSGYWGTFLFFASGGVGGIAGWTWKKILEENQLIQEYKGIVDKAGSLDVYRGGLAALRQWKKSERPQPGVPTGPTDADELIRLIKKVPKLRLDHRARAEMNRHIWMEVSRLMRRQVSTGATLPKELVDFFYRHLKDYNNSTPSPTAGLAVSRGVSSEGQQSGSPGGVPSTPYGQFVPGTGRDVGQRPQYVGDRDSTPEMLGTQGAGSQHMAVAHTQQLAQATLSSGMAAQPTPPSGPPLPQLGFQRVAQGMPSGPQGGQAMSLGPLPLPGGQYMQGTPQQGVVPPQQRAVIADFPQPPDHTGTWVDTTAMGAETPHAVEVGGGEQQVQFTRLAKVRSFVAEVADEQASDCFALDANAGEESDGEDYVPDLCVKPMKQRARTPSGEQESGGRQWKRLAGITGILRRRRRGGGEDPAGAEMQRATSGGSSGRGSNSEQV